MLMPKRVKYRKMHRGRIRGVAARCNKVDVRRVRAAVPRAGVGCRHAPSKPAANRVHARRAGGQDLDPSLPAQVRFVEAGRDPSGHRARATSNTGLRRLKPGTVIYEIGSCDRGCTARKAFNRVAHKLPVKVRMIKRRHF